MQMHFGRVVAEFTLQFRFTAVFTYVITYLFRLKCNPHAVEDHPLFRHTDNEKDALMGTEELG